MLFIHHMLKCKHKPNHLKMFQWCNELPNTQIYKGCSITPKLNYLNSVQSMPNLYSQQQFSVTLPVSV